MQLPDDPEQELLPGSGMFLAVENCHVRGGYILRPQQFFFHGVPHRAAHYRLPISEGLINQRYVPVGALLLRSALRQEPHLYALGMGGSGNPLPRMLQAAGWSISSVPFYFRVVHSSRFLRKVRAIRNTRWRAALLDFAAWTGLGSIAIRVCQSAVKKQTGVKPRFSEEDRFGDWADTIWQSSRAEYAMVAARDQPALHALYPGNKRFLRIRVDQAGWAVLLDTTMQGDRYFGDLRVGTIVDSMARPEDAGQVVEAARRFLEERGVDLIISNQSHAAWTTALRDAGFLKGPSNFLFAASRELAAMGGAITAVHINRGDGDGPVHL
ncbi:MAG: hypothetical protein JO323_05805 [Acidobacteriia bacterium]|nr:hypothetical protein [Terriglobia bacterium]